MKKRTKEEATDRELHLNLPTLLLYLLIAQEAQKHHQKFQTKQKYFVNLVNIFLITLFQIKSIAFIFS